MLVRASRKPLPSVSQRSLQASCTDFHLPWLCPALYTPIPRQRYTLSSNRDQAFWKSNRSSTISSELASSRKRPTRRGHAFAAIAEPSPLDGGFVPFEPPNGIFSHSGTADGTWRPVEAGPPGPGVFDPKTAIVIDQSPTTTAAIFRSHDGISGDLAEIHQTLHACLQVGRLDRAAALMRRLNVLYKADAPGLIAAHNDYLRELIYHLSITHDKTLLTQIQNWFEIELRGKRVPPDATTYALMLHSSLQVPDREEVSQETRRYLKLAGEDGVSEETQHVLTGLSSEKELDIFDKINQKSEVVLPPITTIRPEESDKIPEVKPMLVKGLGLQSLRQSLSIFADASSTPKDSSKEVVKGGSPQNAIARQRALEQDTFRSALKRWREESMHQKKMGINSSLGASPIGALMWGWHEKLVPLIRQEIERANEAEGKDFKNAADKERCRFGPFLQYLPPETLSAVTILTTVSKLSTEGRLDEGSKLSHVVAKIGESVQDESIAETVKLNSTRMHKVHGHSDRLAKLRAFIKRRNPRSSFAKMLRLGESMTDTMENLQWSLAIKVRVGTLLLWHLMEVSNIDVVSTHPETGQEMTERQPIFFHTFQYQKGRKIGIVRLHKAVASKIAKEPVSSVLSKNLPMVIEPKPWSDFREGGFLEHFIPVVRLKSMDVGRRYSVTACSNGDMAHTFAGLDVLGKTPWRINRAVLEVMIEAWNTGEKFADMPPEDPVVELPPEPSPSEDPQKRIDWLRQLKTIENFKAGQKSNRCFQNFQLEVARAFANETFYFPHNVDFRGRAYPMVPFFNHIGADNCRGLLLFACGKELGSVGLSWLKIHLANLYGYDKASFREREEFTMEHLPDIYDSAANPMRGKRWWLKAEDPWQCLSACIELKNALDSPDPQHFVSHLAIHQDGTCNGLQHYAALGGDAIGAKQVNLEPSDRPSDIYTAVAEIVKAEVVKDAAHGNLCALSLEGRVTRKVVKQTVMTNVYGVTFIGAKLQVRKQLDQIFADSLSPHRVSVEDMAQYVAKKIFEALSHMFNGAHDIQHWLGACAGRIAQSVSPEQLDAALVHAKGKADSVFTRVPRGGKASKAAARAMTFTTPVIWTNPLRMPVVQPYRTSSAKKVSTNLQAISIQVHSSNDPVSKRKQLQAFPPNFIHSLDASHMILTALKCNEMGLTFASVHDSFWTHAADVDTMNTIIRNEFVRMHSEDIVGRLATEFATRYKGYFYLTTVKVGTAIGNRILSWRRSIRTDEALKTKSMKLRELQMEKQRLDLIASQDPKERERGLSMVTPAQMFQTIADETKLSPEESLQGAGIGEIPTLRTAKLQVNEQLEVGDHGNAQSLDPDTEDHYTVPSGEAKLDEVSGGLEESEEIQCDASKSVKAKKTTRKRMNNVWLWLPLTFPPVPKKGDFDVSRLKKSQYFFS
ncbi:MAG: hypothetical protein Q9191_005000 [Dirinaria sp. TL-2023a]